MVSSKVDMLSLFCLISLYRYYLIGYTWNFFSYYIFIFASYLFFRLLFFILLFIYYLIKILYLIIYIYLLFKNNILFCKVLKLAASYIFQET